jgi:hypothetical protein
MGHYRLLSSLFILLLPYIAHAQCVGQNIYGTPFGLNLVGAIHTDLPTTNLGGGGPYSQQRTFGPAARKDYNVIPMFHADAVTAIDPTNGGLYTVEASAHLSSLTVTPRQMSTSISIGGEDVAPGLGIESDAESDAVWWDTLCITGVPPDQPVLLRVTKVTVGSLAYTAATQAFLGQNIVAHIVQVSVYSGSSVGDEDYYDTPGSITFRKYYYLTALPGLDITLANVIQANLEAADGSWSNSGSLNAASIYVDVLTPGAILTTASGADYSSP